MDAAGKIFGTETRRNIDYICLDADTAKHRAGNHGYVRTMSGPSDHTVVYQDINFGDDAWRTAAAAKRGRPKPIGWALHNPTGWKDHINKSMGNRTWSTTSTIPELNEVLAKGMHFGRRTVPGRYTAAVSTTRRELEQKLRRADDEDARKAALRELWHRRKHFRAERERNKNAYVLEHLREGGWGKHDMLKSMASVMRLRHADGSSTTMPDDIGEMATKYYKEMFAPGNSQDPHEQRRSLTGSRNRRGHQRGV